MYEVHGDTDFPEQSWLQLMCYTIKQKRSYARVQLLKVIESIHNAY